MEALKERAAVRKVRLTRAGLGKRAADEAQIYRAIGLAPIEPELREDRGEIQAAEADKLPTLVELGDLKGDLHMHTTASDGANSIEEMAQAALSAATSTSPLPIIRSRSKITNGLTEKGFLSTSRKSIR